MEKKNHVVISYNILYTRGCYFQSHVLSSHWGSNAFFGFHAITLFSGILDVRTSSRPSLHFHLPVHVLLSYTRLFPVRFTSSFFFHFQPFPLFLSLPLFFFYFNALFRSIFNVNTSDSALSTCRRIYLDANLPPQPRLICLCIEIT